MREKELRLALVLYGGVSLAVYMFGVCREIAKLTRASKLLYDFPVGRRPDARYPGTAGDSEEIYFDLLRRLSAHTELRVIVDIIAGASAGGINGVFLARALAHDLPLEPLRDMWLDNADVTRLVEADALAGRFSKRFMTPIVNRMLRFDPVLAQNDEARAKFDRFVRSRWFQPPFSGARFAGWMVDAAEAMDTAAEWHRQGLEAGTIHSLMPDDHSLDLFVSLTDYNGHSRLIRLEDPAFAVELDHQFNIAFRYRRSASGAIESEFEAADVPALVFAARATSSYPGAFPPATAAEIDAVIRDRGGDWALRERFLADKLAAIARSGRDPLTVPFVDGSVVNNKPFAAAISALSGRPASREVVRRIVFVDPNPDIEFSDTEILPGFFRAIFSSIAEIPRNEPIHHELDRIAALNEQIAVVREVAGSAGPRIRRQVDVIIAVADDPAPTADRFALWRETANQAAAAEAGFAFQSYLHLRILTVARHLREMAESLARQDLAGLGKALARPLLAAPRAAGGEMSQEAAAFLRAFDADFRVRHLRFVIRELNDLYATDHPLSHADEIDPERLDEIKAEFYALLDHLKARLAHPPSGPEAQRAAECLAGPETPPVERLQAIATLGAALDLAAIDARLDEIFSTMVLNYLPEWARHDLTVAYIGFPFFDVLTLPMTQWEDLGELDLIRVFRISPSDAGTIRDGLAMDKLKGIRLRRFAAFFNRSWRENDYLWGRLVAADRLVTLVLSAAGEAGAAIDALKVKKWAFEAILAAEAPHLKADPDLIAGLMEEVAAIG